MRHAQIWFLLFAMLFVLATPVLLSQSAPAKKTQKPQENLPPGLSGEIRHQLASLPFYSVFDFVRFTLEGKKVTLTGQVVRHSLKDDAEAAMKSIEGVDAVVNQIEVLPASPSDNELRRAIYRALYEDPTLARYSTQNVPPIHIIVKNGNLSLEGYVESLSDKNLAASRAGSVTSLLSLKNNLVVRPKGGAAE